MKWKVEVKVVPKKGIRDPQGEAVARALTSLGYDGVSKVRVGKLITFFLEAADEKSARSQVEEACQRLLSNPVIEDFTFSLFEGSFDK